MSKTNPIDRYIEHLNRHILPFIDYVKLQESYETDMTYAKGVLTHLHEAMASIYGSERLGAHHGDEGFVVIPGVVRGMESGSMCLALLDLDLSSSGEHWGTTFLCEFGVIQQGGDSRGGAAKILAERIGNYDYGYTAEIPGDIHVDEAKFPAELKSALDDFRDYSAEFSADGLGRRKRTPAEKASVLEEIREKAKELKNAEMDAVPPESSAPEV